jgi:hypothetical protein
VKSKFQLYKDDKATNPMREVTKPEKEDEEKKAAETAKPAKKP